VVSGTSRAFKLKITQEVSQWIRFIPEKRWQNRNKKRKLETRLSEYGINLQELSLVHL